MDREELEELHYITPINNVPSICERGILSHHRAESVRHDSVAMPEVQDIRAGKRVPQGRPLHEYTNLYVCARNPMLYKRQAQHASLCVLRVEPEVLDLAGVVVTDGNAASKYTRFAAAPAGLRIVDRQLAFAEWWTDPDFFRRLEKTRAKSAEVLVPDVVPPSFVLGAYVSCEASRVKYDALNCGLQAVVNPHLFFL